MTTVCASPQDAIALVEQTLEEEFGASPDPEPDDHLHSELDVPSINRLRAVIGFLRTQAQKAEAA
jgi:hypothetical protein